MAKRIDGFEAGEEGERTTAKALTVLPAEFLVHHDLHIDGSEANVDHVVVGPTGVYVIDSKHWTGRVSTAKGTLWSGRHPQRRALMNLAWETACVAGALTSTGVGVPVSVISVTGSGRGDRAFEIDGTWVLPVERLTDFLTAGPSHVPAGVARVASEALSARRLPRARYPSNSRLEPPPSTAHHATERLDPISVPLAASRAAQPKVDLEPTQPGSSGANPRPSAMPPRPPSVQPRIASASASTRRSQRRRPAHTTRAAQLAVGVLLIAVSGAALRYLPQVGRVAGALTSTQPRTVAPPASSARTSPAATPLRVTWSCPSPSAGWTATFRLSGNEQATLGTWEIQVAASEEGPWIVKATGQGDMRLTGLPPGRTGWIRGGNISSVGISGDAIAEGRLTTPTGC